MTDFPEDMQTRDLVFRGARQFETGELGITSVRVQASRSLRWLDSGGIWLESLVKGKSVGEGDDVVVTLPVCDASGVWVNPEKNKIVALGPDEYTHSYLIAVTYTVSGTNQDRFLERQLFLPSGEQPYVFGHDDAVNGTEGGILMSVPWAKGDKGDPGQGAGAEFMQLVPLAQWSITHNFGRFPNVSVFIGEEQVDADVTSTTTTTTVQFPVPTAGRVILS